MPQFIVTLRAPATVEGALAVDAPNEEEAKKLALTRAGRVIWSKSNVEEPKAEVVRLYPIK